MSDNRKEAEEKMAKAIFISGDGWLAVFDLLAPSQLGLGIALISHRFDFYVDEHFKTRKWSLGITRILGKKKMEIFKNYNFWKPLPIPKIQLPRKVIGFERIIINFIDQNAIAFLGRFHPLFASFYPINLIIIAKNDCILEFILRNIWPMIAKNICSMHLMVDTFQRLRQFVPSFLNDCPSLRFVISCAGDLFAEFPCDDNAMASDGQALAKWLFTPHPVNVPKVFKCELDTDDGNLASKIEAFKTAFANASSPVNFIVVTSFPLPFVESVVPFDLTNELTQEQLALKRIINSDHFLLIRCPIARDEIKWAKWEKEAIGWTYFDQWNRIDIHIDDERKIGDGLLSAMVGTSDQQK
ncbi:hypothetical protein niasHT_012481 [Heterodera trifolii]|uniref:Uncharacterized protein n=1 Tax=Heterodera trifolii TaxID=157864 RepID=A0ABD2KUK1_9BILA